MLGEGRPQRTGRGQVQGQGQVGFYGQRVLRFSHYIIKKEKYPGFEFLLPKVDGEIMYQKVAC